MHLSTKRFKFKNRFNLIIHGYYNLKKYSIKNHPQMFVSFCFSYVQQEKAVRERRIRDLEAELDLQSARAEATATALRMMEDQRAADTAAAVEQHREELAAAHSE